MNNLENVSVSEILNRIGINLTRKHIQMVFDADTEVMSEFDSKIDENKRLSQGSESLEHNLNAITIEDLFKKIE